MNRRGAFNLFSVLALFTWIGAVVSTVIQKTNADKTIRDSVDISAVQIQQLNGSATAHALVMLIVACAATIPLLIVAVSALLARVERDAEPPRPVEPGQPIST